MITLRSGKELAGSKASNIKESSKGRNIVANNDDDEEEKQEENREQNEKQKEKVPEGAKEREKLVQARPPPLFPQRL